MPQNRAGVRRLPPRSFPVASQTEPAASAAAEPPDDPPAVSRVSHGLRVIPKTGLNVCPPAHSGTFDFATGTAPFASSRATVASEAAATLSANIGEP